MNMKNLVIIEGRLVRDIELRGTEGSEMCFVNLAVQRNFKNKDGEYDADFPSAIAFGERAKSIAKYFKKGDCIKLQATVRTSTREVEENGNKVKRTFTDLVVEGFDFPLTRAAKGAQTEQAKEKPETEDSDFSEVAGDDDLPF